ncbi:tetratricopeptide repeat 6 [Brachionus plicatilis]|uniref:Tetratricopeptide repeat 6 n=1 Tax=Brachionus plicatilis TaxID=10195 RepID=A0A3M7RJP5_BRAPC|nr:tetratricopeptide repeat 6 [Brachionus plicatilis]
MKKDLSKIYKNKKIIDPEESENKIRFVLSELVFKILLNVYKTSTMVFYSMVKFGFHLGSFVAIIEITIFYVKYDVKKSLADIALAQGKKYVMQDSTKTSGKNSVKKKPRGPNRFKNAVLGMEFLIQIESDIYNKNIKALTRCHSLDQTKPRTKTVHQDDELLAEAARVRHIRRPSVSKYTSFEEYKKQLGFKDSKWATEQDEYFDKEREWTRDIWNVWFDQVITGDESQLNDSNEKPKLFDIKKETKIESEKESGDVEEMEEEGDKIRKIVKSPTPYATYSQINFEDLDEKKLNFQHIKVAEKEIEVLNRRLEQKLLVFDLVRRGTLYRKLGFIKKALDDFNLAIDTEPKFVDAYWQRHLVYLVQDRRKDATEDLNQIIKLNRSHSGAYLSLGDLHAQRNDLQMAIVNYSQAVKFNPNDDQAFFKRGKLYEQKGDVRMAMDDYLTTTRLNPKNSEAWFKHGMSYFNSKNWHYAIVDFTELIKHNPLNQAQARLYRGKCHLNLEDYQAAFDDFCVALHLNPNDWQSYYHRACLLRNNHIKKIYTSELFKEYLRNESTMWIRKQLDPTRAIQDLSISILIEEGYENLKSYLHRGILYTELEQNC